MTDKLTYEEELAELTALVDNIGREDCPVDTLEKKVGRAAELIRDLRGRLSATELTVRSVLSELDSSTEKVTD